MGRGDNRSRELTRSERPKDTKRVKMELTAGLRSTVIYGVHQIYVHYETILYTQEPPVPLVGVTKCRGHRILRRGLLPATTSTYVYTCKSTQGPWDATFFDTILPWPICVCIVLVIASLPVQVPAGAVYRSLGTKRNNYTNNLYVYMEIKRLLK